MAKPIETTAEPDDIFGARLQNAMATATAPIVEAPQNPPPAETRPPLDKVVELPHPADPGAEDDAAPPNAEAHPHEARPFEKNVGLKMLLQRSLKSGVRKLCADLGDTLGGVAVDDSNLLRPYVERLLQRRDLILEVAQELAPKPTRPPNADAVGMAEFDELLGRILDEAEKRSRRKKRART